MMTYQSSETSRNDPSPPAETRTTTEARQSVTGQKVRYVLYWALGGVIVIYAVIYFFFLR
jgi:hypothetical protein